jgi:NAD(P)-dependent dehydrogenase (short-subunit alcohol dehydrogenase family)
MAKMVNGKVVVITGSGSGIGRELALRFAAHGASVVVNDVGKTGNGDPSAHVVAGEITAAGGKAAVSTDSVADWDSANRIVDCALSHFGRIDCVVNNNHRAIDRVSGQRCCERCLGTDLRRACQRNLFIRSNPYHPFRASQRGLDSRDDRRTCYAGIRGKFLREHAGRGANALGAGIVQAHRAVSWRPSARTVMSLTERSLAQYPRGLETTPPYRRSGSPAPGHAQ